jgi:hypothetical protein
MGGVIFLSTDKGNSWSEKNIGLLNNFVHTIAISSNNIFAGTGGGGIFKAKLSDFGISSIEENSANSEPDFFIFPNPVSDFINIFPETINKIEIISALGETVIKSEAQNRIDVSYLTPGIYFFKTSEKIIKFIKL